MSSDSKTTMTPPPTPPQDQAGSSLEMARGAWLSAGVDLSTVFEVLLKQVESTEYLSNIWPEGIILLLKYLSALPNTKFCYHVFQVCKQFY